MVIWRYTTNGQLDTSFNGRGYVTFDNPSGADDSGNRITIDPSGNILVAGESFGEMAIWRYTDTGVLDTTFNGRGYVFHYGAAGGGGCCSGDRAYAVAVDSQGKIYAAGESASARGDPDVVVWRYR